MVKKKGFTLVELLGVIIILGLVGLIVIPSITKLIRDSKQDLYENQVRTIEESARNWGIQNTDQLSETENTYLSISDLINGGFIEQDTIKDPRSNEDMNGCVVISYNSQSSKYKYVYNDDSCGDSYDIVNLTPSDPEYVCYNFDEVTGTILNYDKSNSVCSGDVVIPNSIDGVAIQHIGKAAFYNPSEQWCYKDETLPINIFEFFMGPPDEYEVTEEDFLAAMIAIEENYINYDVYDVMLENGYDQFPVSYNHTVSDGYDGCYYYGTADSNKIDSIFIPSSVETIGDYAFMSNSITELDISHASSLESIGEFAFSKNIINTLNLGSIEGLTTIGSGAFSHNNLTTINLSGLTNLTTLGEIGAVRHLSTSFVASEEEMFIFFPLFMFGFFPIYDDEYPDANMHDVNEGSGVFEGNNLTSINLGNLTTIGDHTFSTNAISTVNLSNLTNLNVIGKNAFANNDITSINLSNLSGLTEIKNGAFAYNDLTTANLAPLTGLTNLGSDDEPYFPLVFFIAMIIGELEPYEEFPYDGEIPYFPHIGYGVFEANYIDTLNLPSTNVIENIGKGAFIGNHLQTVDLSVLPHLSSVSSYAFMFNNISTVDFSGLTSLTVIGDGAFGYNGIESVNLSNLTSLERIGNGAFDTNGITSLNLTGLTNLMTIGAGSFYGNSISSLNLNGLTNLRIISYGAFSENIITSLNLTGLSNLLTIDEEAFEYNQLSSVTIPASVTYIGYEAFWQEVTYPWSSVTIGFNGSNPITRFNSDWEDIGWPINLMP